MEQGNRVAAVQAPQIQPFNAGEHMGGVPLFNGDNLFRFLSSCDLVIQAYSDRRLNFQIGQNARILNSIKKRISDDCYKRLTIYPLDNWDQLRVALLETFGDSRTEEQILIKLINLKQNHLHLDEYYTQFIELGQLLTLKADQAQRDFYTNLMLKRFIANLYAPLNAAVKSLNAQNIPQAFHYAREFILMFFNNTQ